jgi:hypothetical protein
VGKSQDLTNVTNLVAVLFMMVGMSAASGIIYLPPIVSGACRDTVRQAVTLIACMLDCQMHAA